MKRSKSKVVPGIVVGGLVGLSALAIFCMCRKKESSLDSLGKMISYVGEILESNHIEEPASLQNFGEKIQHQENTVVAAVEWIAKGISLWKKLKN